MKLSTDQVETIEARVDQNNITIGTLRDDLIDHLCCVVEDKLTKHVVFEKALDDALRELAPNGLHELEEETVFLLNSQKIIRMKKLMYLIGLLSAMSMSIGLWFRFMRWPGADELMSYGFLSFTLLYLPMMLVDRLKMKIQSALSERLRLILGLTSAIIVGTSVVFKLMHLRGADVLLVVGALVFSFGFLPFLFFSMYKKSIA